MKPDDIKTDWSRKQIDHIAIAVRDIEAAQPLYELLGFDLETVEEVESQDVRVAKLDAGNVNIELLEPLTENSTITTFLKRNGPGLHHICIEEDELEETLNRLKKEGFDPIYDTPKPGAENRNINFLHPDDTNGVLIELQQAKQSDTSNT